MRYPKPGFIRKLPGHIATGLAILVTCFWTYWGTGEMYYEGWGLSFPTPLRYLLVAAFFLAFALVALTWPGVGGWLLILAGGAFTVWWSNLAAARGWLSQQWVLSTLFPLGGLLVVVGALFILERRYRRQRRLEGWTPPTSWPRRNLRYILAVGFPLLTVIAVSIHFAPLILTRVDDGGRGARLIQGNGVTLTWAPQGPGWNWRQESGGYPSWDQIALYGVPPVGLAEKPGYQDRHATADDMQNACLCRYLSEDGKRLLPEPPNIWRMPTTQEIVRSLVRGGENARCTWDGDAGTADCAMQPNKDTPLWAADQEPIYYWSADEHDAESAWYVPYTGGGRYGGAIGYQPKSWANPRHGYRCVREP